MFNNKASRIVVAGLLAGASLGASHFSNHVTAQASSPYKGNLVMTDWQPPDGCGPFSNGTVSDGDICNAMIAVNGLYNVDDKGHYVTDLATTYPTVQNGGAKLVKGNLVATLTMKKGLKWSDGSPMTMYDYKFSVDLNEAMGSNAPLDQIKSLKVVNNTTAVQTMKGAYTSFIENAYPLYFVPQKYIEKKFKSTSIATLALSSAFGGDLYNSPSDVYSGPYMVKSWAKDDSSIVLVPNPYYATQSSTKPRYASITFVTVTTASSGAMARDLQSPSVKVNKVENFQYDDLPTLMATKYKVTVQPNLEFEHLELNTEAGHPLSNVRIRQALQYGLDKKALFNYVFPHVTGDVSKYLLHSVIPNISPWADTAIPSNPYNLAKAQALLTKAGYANSPTGSGKHVVINFWTTSTNTRRQIGANLAKQWGKLGVILVQHYTSPTAKTGQMFGTYSTQGVLKRRNFDVADFAYQIAPDPQALEANFDPAYIPTAANVTSSASNYAGAGPEQFKYMAAARYATDPMKRHALLNQWQQAVYENAYWIPLFARANIVATDGTIGNFAPNPTSSGNLWNAWRLYAE